MSWKAAPNCQAVDAFQQRWDQYFPYAFPPFCLISKILRQLSRQSVPKMIIVTPLWPSQPWYPLLLSMSIQTPILLPKSLQLLTSPSGKIHPLIENSSLELVAWLVSGIPCLRRGFQAGPANSSSIQGGEEQLGIMSQPGRSGICGVVAGGLIRLNAL